ncbi:MAG TPA: DUF748 domain-containing protein [Pseudomonadales bacterium]|nr:DUF748 domain-containing protein [Pseudomonadales bacterium]
MMNSKDWIQKARQLACNYRRTLITVFSIITLYTLLGFFILPWSIQRYLTHSFAENLQRGVEVHAVRFNPYKVKLQIEGFKIADTDSTPLLSFDLFSVNYSALSVFRLRYGIEEIALQKPYIKLDANGKGGFTLLDAFANLSSQSPDKPAEEPESTTEVPAVWLGNLQISGGLIDYSDAARAGGFKQRVELPTVAINDFYTKKKEHANRFELEIADEQGGTVTLGAVLENLKPLRLNGDIAIGNLDLAPAWQWLSLPVNFNLKAPHLAFKTQFSVQMDSALDLQAMKTSLELKDLSIYSKDNAESPVIQLPLLGVNDVNVNLLQQSVTVGSFQANDGVVNLVLDKQGVANLQNLFAQTAAEEPTPAAAPPASTPTDTNAAPAPANTAPTPAAEKPWDVLVHQIRFNNYTINIRDEQPAQALVLGLTPLTISIDEWKPLSSDRFSVQIQSGLVNESKAAVGQLQINTQLQLTPLIADTKVDLQQFQLPTIQPYVQDAVRAQIKDGALTAALDVHFESSEKPVIEIKGTAGIKKLSVKEQKGDKSLLQWDALDIAGLSFQLPNNELKIEKVTIEKPDTGFVINSDGSTNIEKMLVAAKPATSKAVTAKAAAPKPAAKAEKSAAPMKLAIGTVDIRNANLGFADLSMKPNFKVAMSQLSGSIKDLSSDAKKQASINLKGKVDRYAPVTINGKMNPLAAKPSLDVQFAFNNLELTTFTPYSGTYAGFKIKQGQLSLDINYQLVDNKIQGKNKIVMNQLQLGESVESQKAIDLPLRLAIALLRDENGVIDLGFEVGGDLNDPQFSVGGILWKVLSNMVMKVVTSPFKAIASLAGGGGEAAEGVDKIDFAAGQSQLDAASLGKLKMAADLLNKRNNLRITVQGNALPADDRAALQNKKLAMILQQDSNAPMETYLSASAAVEDGGAYRALNRHYKKQSNYDLGDLQGKIKAQRTAKGEQLDDAALKQAAYEQAWKTARDKMAVSDDELRQLALERATQIKSVLVEQNGVAPERVFVLDVNTDPEKASLTTALSLDVN